MSSSKELTNFIKIGTAGNDDANKRIDRIIRTIIPSLSLGSIYKEIRQGRIRINGEKTGSGNRINAGDSIEIHKSLAEIVKKDIKAITSKKENKKAGADESNRADFTSKVEILFENDFFIAINKPSGILTHAGAKTNKNSPTLDDAIKKLLIKTSRQSLAFSPAPLHRLDKETSGVVFFSKSIEGARLFTLFLREKRFIKKYIALLDGHLTKPCTWKDFLAREESPAEKEAVTHIKPLLYSSGHTLALVEIETGRYRQIRKQCAMHGFPLSGDKYAGKKTSPKVGAVAIKQGFLLHCWKIELRDDKDTGASDKLGFSSITAPLPDLFFQKIKLLFENDNIKKIFN